MVLIDAVGLSAHILALIMALRIVLAELFMLVALTSVPVG
jgi:hypothetical protein